MTIASIPSLNDEAEPGTPAIPIVWSEIVRWMLAAAVVEIELALIAAERDPEIELAAYGPGGTPSSKFLERNRSDLR